MLAKMLARLGVGLPLVTLAAGAGAQQHAAPAPMSDEDMTKSAMSAAPAAVAKRATVVAVGADAKMRTLRQGDNGFTCLPDDPSTPGTDPMCGDANAMAWAQAWIEHKEPPAGKVGFLDMLLGGAEASNTDPYATGPPPRDYRGATGSHVIIGGGQGGRGGDPGS